MSRGSAASMFGGAGGRGSRVSLASLEGLRNVMRNEGEKDPAIPAVAPDDKKTMQGLNERLSGFLGRVRDLEKANKALEDEISDILEKRGSPKGRDWEKIEKPLADLRKKVKDMTRDNAKLLLRIDNTKLANDDFKNKLAVEKQAKRALEHELAGLKKIIDSTQLNRLDLESQIESTNEELVHVKKDHEDEVHALRKKIRESLVVVEMDSKDTDLAEALNQVRVQYEKMATKNLKDTEDWYNNKFDNIRVEVAASTETLQTGRSELNDLRSQKQRLEIDIQTMLNMIRSLGETLKDTQGRYGNELRRLNGVLLQLEAELAQVRAQVERQVEDYQDLLHVKMKLEAEIDKYRHLINGIMAEEGGTHSAA
ncbi:keratin, type I cytoskeletal 18 [Aplochiton taeniatus]